jgi:hypothetical protein
MQSVDICNEGRALYFFARLGARAPNLCEQYQWFLHIGQIEQNHRQTGFNHHQARLHRNQTGQNQNQTGLSHHQTQPD